MNDNIHVTNFREGFEFGYTQITPLNDITGMEFGILRLRDYQTHDLTVMDTENALIVLRGYGEIVVNGQLYFVGRKNIFTEKPWAFLIPCGSRCTIHHQGTEELEIAVIKTKNTRVFDPVIVDPKDILSEQRGKGQLGGTMHRAVRAILGDPNAPEHARPRESNLVIGEVVNLQGRWSSYPPHGHPQPEIYHYRFDHPDGYGISHVAEPAPVVRNYDTVKILDGTGHDQCAAPGYTMWYLWAIRHLPDKRYEGNPPFTFLPEHEWVNDPDSDSKILKPEDIA